MQAINPKMLMFVEGTSGVQTPITTPEAAFWGGSFASARHTPVQLRDPSKLVYSPHVYGPGETLSWNLLPRLSFNTFFVNSLSFTALLLIQVSFMILCRIPYVACRIRSDGMRSTADGGWRSEAMAMGQCATEPIRMAVITDPFVGCLTPIMLATT